jgi:hypothetical protein
MNNPAWEKGVDTGLGSATTVQTMKEWIGKCPYLNAISSSPASA